MLQKKLETFLKKKTNKKISKNTNLITSEILDSYSIIELVSYIEDELKLKCPMNKISTANFNNLTLIVKFLKKFNKKLFR
jgi:acyl carrier protein